MPEPFGSNQASQQQHFADDFKVESIQILAKESDGLSIKVIEEIDISTAFSGTDRFYIYRYLSNKPFKTLPEAVSTRVHDKVPIRALAQATTGNRVMYGNFIEKHGSPDFLNYFLGYTQKPKLEVTPVFRQQRKEYPNHTVKQNRSYKVGVVLVDRYGHVSFGRSIATARARSFVVRGSSACDICAWWFVRPITRHFAVWRDGAAYVLRRWGSSSTTTIVG